MVVWLQNRTVAARNIKIVCIAPGCHRKSWAEAACVCVFNFAVKNAPFPFRQNLFHMWQISRTHAGTFICDGGDASTQRLINAGCDSAATPKMLLFSVGAVRCCSPHRGKRGGRGTVKRNKWTTPINWLESPPSPCVCARLILSPSLRLDNAFPPQVHSGSFIRRRPPRGYWHHMALRQESFKSCRRRQFRNVPFTRSWSVGGIFCVRFPPFFFLFFVHALPVTVWLFSCFLPKIRRHANEGSMVAQNCP